MFNGQKVYMHKLPSQYTTSLDLIWNHKLLSSLLSHFTLMFNILNQCLTLVYTPSPIRLYFLCYDTNNQLLLLTISIHFHVFPVSCSDTRIPMWSSIHFTTLYIYIYVYSIEYTLPLMKNNTSSLVTHILTSHDSMHAFWPRILSRNTITSY